MNAERIPIGRVTFKMAFDKVHVIYKQTFLTKLKNVFSSIQWLLSSSDFGLVSNF
jgi:hypothetical protein